MLDWLDIAIGALGVVAIVVVVLIGARDGKDDQ